MTEVVFATLLVGLVLIGGMNGVGSVLAMRRVAEQRHHHQTLAMDLLNEILQQRYEEPDDPPAFGVESPETAGNRTTWDDVDDYAGWSSEPVDRDGRPWDGYAGWTRAVSVAWAEVDDPTITSPTEQGLKRITVTVTDPSGSTTVMEGLRSRWGVLEGRPPSNVTLQTWLANEMEVAGSATIHGSTSLTNHAEDQ